MSDIHDETLPVRVVFSLGSNIGDSPALLRRAAWDLSATPRLEVCEISSVYKTKPVGVTDQPDFLNLVITADVDIDPQTLLERCQTIETACGRIRDPENPGGPRTLDIDIIRYGDEEISTDNLVIPHPRAHERQFVLAPWLEIDRDAALPQGRVDDLLWELGIDGVEKLDEIVVDLS